MSGLIMSGLGHGVAGRLEDLAFVAERSPKLPAALGQASGCVKLALASHPSLALFAVGD